MEQPVHKHFNLELELKSNDWIIEKIKSNETYAQNLYAALCNNQFIKNEVISILREDIWFCTWRYAGGIIADIKGQGDYLDYYCSGITDIKQDQTPEPYRKRIKQYEPEGSVTEEIKQDLFKLGWIILTEDK